MVHDPQFPTSLLPRRQLSRECIDESPCIKDAKGVFGFGLSTVLKQDVADRLGSGALSWRDVGDFLADFRELTHTKWRLSSEDMSAAERPPTQEPYTLLLTLLRGLASKNGYFRAL